MRAWPLILLVACKGDDGGPVGATPPEGVEAIDPVGDDPDPGRLARIRTHPLDVAVRDQLPPPSRRASPTASSPPTTPSG